MVSYPRPRRGAFENGGCRQRSALERRTDAPRYVPSARHISLARSGHYQDNVSGGWQADREEERYELGTGVASHSGDFRADIHIAGTLAFAEVAFLYGFRGTEPSPVRVYQLVPHETILKKLGVKSY